MNRIIPIRKSKRISELLRKKSESNQRTPQSLSPNRPRKQTKKHNPSQMQDRFEGFLAGINAAYGGKNKLEEELKLLFKQARGP